LVWPVILAAALAAILALPTSLAAQTAPAPAKASAAKHKPAHAQKHSAAGHSAKTQPAKAATAPATATPAATPAAAVPPAPQMPAWPVNDQPTPATITWNSHGLHIEATNSSLKQILDEVSTVTGAKFQGLDGDQRIFGTYGPASARDVLSQLLQGLGYNILMIGDQGSGTPRQIQLTKQGAAVAGGTPASHAAKPAARDEDDADAEESTRSQQQMQEQTRQQDQQPSGQQGQGQPGQGQQGQQMPGQSQDQPPGGGNPPN
jgi:hypothetical protein